MEKVGYLAWLIIALAVGPECSSSDNGSASNATGGSGGNIVGCTPGDQKACDCVGGAKGIQICKDDGGGWNTCEGCSTPNPCGDCDGCCDGSTCVRADEQTAKACGAKGSTCENCDTGYACALGHCVVDTGQCSPASCPSGCCNANQCWQPADQFWMACGKGGAACGSCDYGATCSSGGCNSAMDPNAMFRIRVKSVRTTESMNGETWDALGGLPDPLVCMGIQGKSGCTASCEDTTDCAFIGIGGIIGGTDPLYFSGSELQGLQVTVYDEDVTEYETMGSASFALTNVQSGYELAAFGGVKAIFVELY